MADRLTIRSWHYLTLLLGLFAGLAIFFLAAPLTLVKVGSVVGLCLFYFLWGVVHHLLEEDLHFKIVLEYLLVALLGGLLLLSFIWRAQGGRLL